MNKKSYLNYKNIYFVPSFHNKLQFVLEVRKAFSELQPDIIAIELPDIYYSEVIRAIDLLPSLTMLCIQNSKNSLDYIPIFPSDSMIEGIRLGKENKLPISFIDTAIKDYKTLDDFEPPDDYAIKTLGLEKYYNLVKEYFSLEKTEQDLKREESMAFHLNRLSNNFKKILFIGGMAHWENITKHLEKRTFKLHNHEFELIKSPFLATPSKKSLYALLEELPYLVFKYELARRFNIPFDKWEIIVNIFQEVKQMEVFENENFGTRDIQNLIDYAKKLAFTDNKLIPDLFNILIAGKYTLGEDFTLELLEILLNYKFEANKNLRVIDFDDKNFTLDGKKIKLKKKLPSYIKDSKNNKWQELQIIRKKRDNVTHDDLKEWFFFGFYSHLPEDEILEGFIDRTENKLISEILEEPKIHEFSGNLMDGLDLRESIRDFHKKKLYVREYKKEKIDIGCWLIIFDEELLFQRYPWEMALSSEHNNESDLAFYATNPFMHPISKEIVRAEYGALLAFKPALPDNTKVYSEDLETSEEDRIFRLFILALELNTTNDILYIAEKPPEKFYYDLANKKNKRIFYLPLSRFSNRNLKKLRRFHLLRSKKTRDIADDYI
ncbi:MAG: hypothetical protein U0457_03940 [Candidatus Sericytochromatia bacterium]